MSYIEDYAIDAFDLDAYLGESDCDHDWQLVFFMPGYVRTKCFKCNEENEQVS